MSGNHIPVVNIARLDTEETLRNLDSACRNWGAFQVVGHGVDPAVSQALHGAMHRFFAQPAAEKRAISRSLDNPWGYYDQELTKNALDWKEIFDYGPADGGGIAPQWPTGVPGFKETVIQYYRECENLAFRLLTAIAGNLGLSGSRLAEYFYPRHTSFIRLNYYPQCPEAVAPEQAVVPRRGYMGVNQHTDAGVLTILLQDQQPGLEMYQNGKWCAVEPYPDALVINLGDIVQVWSNDRYRAPLHRVVGHPQARRYTAPFFFSPAYSADYQPLPTTVDRQHPPRYRAINWGEFRRLRAMGDYADYGEEVQISHYRV